MSRRVGDSATGAVTMADVGRAAGVSARTVSNVLSGGATVRPATASRVLDAAETLGYRMNTAARSLRTGRTGRIALIVPDLAIDYFSDLARGVIAQAERRGWAVLIEQTAGSRDRELAAVAGLGGQQSDGVLLHSQALTSSDAHLLAGHDDLVLLGDRLIDAPVDHVVMPNVRAAEAATEHLVRRGCRRIAVIGASYEGTATGSGSLRTEGFRAALMRSGIDLPDDYLIAAEDWHLRDGAAGMARLLSLPTPPDGVFCLNDTLAFGALHAAAEKGVRVPDEVAVVGFDNVRMAAYSVPPLTTIDPGTDQIAQLAIDVLADRTPASRRTPLRYVTEFSLVVRRSA